MKANVSHGLVEVRPPVVVNARLAVEGEMVVDLLNRRLRPPTVRHPVLERLLVVVMGIPQREVGRGDAADKDIIPRPMRGVDAKAEPHRLARLHKGLDKVAVVIVIRLAPRAFGIGVGLNVKPHGVELPSDGGDRGVELFLHRDLALAGKMVHITATNARRLCRVSTVPVLWKQRTMMNSRPFFLRQAM